jgi:outer membrane immunogenic protein
MDRLGIIGVALASSIAFASLASAADLPAKAYTKAPPPVAPIYDWGGFYVGLDAGGASSHDCWTGGIPVPTALGCHDATGGLVGGQVGYRWQMTNWVFGVEAQGDWADLKGSNTSAIGRFGGSYLYTDGIKQNVDMGTVRVNYTFGGPVVARY